MQEANKELHARDRTAPYSHGIANPPAHTLSRDFYTLSI